MKAGGNVRIHESAYVSQKARIGTGTSIWNNSQIREEAEIGESCNIGKDVYIDKGVKIGNRVKIQNGVSVYHGVTVEDDVFLGPHMTFTNDLHPRAFSKDWKVYPTLVKKGTSIGANATIVCNTTLGEYCMVGAGAVVTKDVPPHALVVGNPARVIGFVCRCGHRADKKVEEAKMIIMKCKFCGEEFSIKREDYEMKSR